MKRSPRSSYADKTDVSVLLLVTQIADCFCKLGCLWLILLNSGKSTRACWVCPLGGLVEEMCLSEAFALTAAHRAGPWNQLAECLHREQNEAIMNIHPHLFPLPPRTPWALLHDEAQGSKAKQREERENEITGPMKPLEDRGMLYLHLDRASWGVRGVPLPSHRDPWWHSETCCSLCAISSVVPVAMPTPAPHCGKRYLQWDVSVTTARNQDQCCALTQGQSRWRRFPTLSQRTWRSHTPQYCLCNSQFSRQTNTVIRDFL